MTNKQLQLPAHSRFIENISDPKEKIENAIRISRSNQTRRKRGRFGISQLYSPLSQELEVSHLMSLPSFVNFIDNVKIALRKLNYFE